MDFNLDTIKVIIGLGNPGGTYRSTYHNVGLVFVGKLIKTIGLSKTKRAKYFTHAVWVRASGRKINLVQPTTFMNTSGSAVKAALRFLRLRPDETLVVHDDSDIEVGKFKITFGGGSAGHNGIKSIIDSIGTKNFWRLRIGIRNIRNKKKAMDFILKKISTSDKKHLENSFAGARRMLSAHEPRADTSGFTLFELLIYISIFAIFITGFVGVFINVLRVQNRQIATTAVATELNFSMQKIQQLISQSVATNVYDTDGANIVSSGPILELRDSSAPTHYICAKDNALCTDGSWSIQISDGSGSSLSSITSDRVVVDSLNFIKYAIPDNSTGFVTIEIQMSYKDGLTNPQKAFTQALRASAHPNPIP